MGGTLSVVLYKWCVSLGLPNFIVSVDVKAYKRILERNLDRYDEFVIAIVFLSRDFLTGFRKRKTERKKKAEEELKNWLKEEKKRIKKDVGRLLWV